MSLKNFEQAESCLCRSIELDNSLLWAHSVLGFTLEERKNHADAVEQFKQATALEWEYATPHFGLAEIYRKHLNQQENAIVEYEIVLQFEQRPFQLLRAMIGLSRALEAAGRTVEARQRYQEYLDRFPWGEHAPEALAALERLGAA